jgi:plasmid stabilization system protein ParE
MNSVRFHPEAEEELAEAREWYEKRSEVAAQAFALEIDRAVSRIFEAPLRYPTGWRGEHRFVLDRFPYTARAGFVRAGVWSAVTAVTAFAGSAPPEPGVKAVTAVTALQTVRLTRLGLPVVDWI